MPVYLRETVRPFDQYQIFVFDHIGKPQRVQFGLFFQPIKVYMIKNTLRNWIFVRDHKRRAGHMFDAEAFGKGFDERGFAAAQWTG